MKKKLIIYLLVFCVLGIWTMVLFRIIRSMGDKDTLSGTTKSTLPAQKTDIPKLYPDTSESLMDFPDPFTGAAVVIVDTTTKKIIKKASVVLQLPPAEDPVPRFKYLGYVKPGSGKDGVAIISHNGQERMLKKGDTLYGATLIAIKRDGVIVQYRNRSVTIKAE